MTGPTDPTGTPRSLAAAEAEIAAQQAAAAEAKARAEAAKKAAEEKAKAQPPTPSRTPDQIRADIASTRLELAETVDLLSAKLDVRSRTQSWVKDPANKPQLIAAGVALVSILALMITKKVRS